MRGGGGDFGTNNTIGTIAGDGPGGGPGPFNPGGTSGGNYSIRAQVGLQFTVGGTYTIRMGSDDGRRIELTEFAPGSAPGYSGRDRFWAIRSWLAWSFFHRSMSPGKRS